MGSDVFDYGETLYTFLLRYGEEFNYEHEAVSVASGGIVPKVSQPCDAWHLGHVADAQAFQDVLVRGSGAGDSGRGRARDAWMPCGQSPSSSAWPEPTVRRLACTAGRIRLCHGERTAGGAEHGLVRGRGALAGAPLRGLPALRLVREAGHDP